jgi:pilus assembly protein Flp/PilA
MAQETTDSSKSFRRPAAWLPPASGSVPFLSQKEFMMSKFASAVKTFVADENGVTALEYGMIAALIGAVIAGTVKALGGSIETAFNSIKTAMTP